MALIDQHDKARMAFLSNMQAASIASVIASYKGGSDVGTGSPPQRLQPHVSSASGKAHTAPFNEQVRTCYLKAHAICRKGCRWQGIHRRR